MKAFSWMMTLLAGALMVSAAHADEAGAKAFAGGLADKAIIILENDNLSKKGKQSQLEGLFRDSADLEWVGKFVLGKHWRAANAEQKRAYLTNYKEFIVHNFTDRLTEYSGQQYDIKGVRSEGEPGEYLLTFELKSPGEPTTYIDYRVREKNGHYLIFDIIVEGVSLITTQRSEFNSVVSRKGLDYLIDALAERSKS